MKRRIHIIACRVLALSIIGLPVASISANTLNQLVDSQASNTPCHQVTENVPEYNASFDTKTASPTLSPNKCCGSSENSCPCPAQVSCHQNISAPSAILPIDLLIQPASAALPVAETTSRYHSRNIEPAAIPPIA